jgi:hypothetical protein
MATDKKSNIMKLELKHLAAYLPYRLNAMDSDNGSVRRVTLLHFTYDMATVGHNHLLYEGLILKKHQPILRPLSDLTREDLIEDLGTETSCLDWTTSEREHWIRFYSREHWINNLPYLIYSHLVKNHFDVFGLIEKGLAIDINTI